MREEGNDVSGLALSKCATYCPLKQMPDITEKIYNHVPGTIDPSGLDSAGRKDVVRAEVAKHSDTGDRPRMVGMARRHWVSMLG